MSRYTVTRGVRSAWPTSHYHNKILYTRVGVKARWHTATTCLEIALQSLVYLKVFRDFICTHTRTHKTRNVRTPIVSSASSILTRTVFLSAGWRNWPTLSQLESVTYDVWRSVLTTRHPTEDCTSRWQSAHHPTPPVWRNDFRVFHQLGGKQG